MSIYDRGELILFEAAFRKKVLHVDSYTYFDPTTPTLTVTDPSSLVVYTAPLSKSTTGSAGLYNCVVPSSTGWPVGLYTTKVTAYDGTSLDTIIYERVFELE